MKLHRFVPRSSGRTSRGAWTSNDGRWSFIYRRQRGWFVERRVLGGTTATEIAAREELLKLTGLNDTYFKTRREAVAALELALAGSVLA